jgi:hypothetical protein
MLGRFLNDPPRALHSALALWVRGSDRSSPLVEWTATLPRAVERGPIPSQDVADGWADRNTLGLIKEFPLDLSPLSRVVLASVLATKVTWKNPFEVVPAADHLGAASPWRGRVKEVLFDRHLGSSAMLARTEAAGVVAVHFAQAREDLAVLSVATDPALERQAAFEAAFEIAGLCRDDRLASVQCSLFDLSLGRGHSWEITEHEILAERAGERRERIEGAVLAAWTMGADLDLTASDLFGVNVALSALLDLVGPSPEGDNALAKQSAIASYSPSGFEAAALDVMELSVGGTRRHLATRKGLLRRATLFLDHPYVAIALAGSEADFTRARAGHTDWFCLPLFTAWVAEPVEPAWN